MPQPRCIGAFISHPVHSRGSHLVQPMAGPVSSTSFLTAFRCFVCRDGNLGVVQWGSSPEGRDDGVGVGKGRLLGNCSLGSSLPFWSVTAGFCGGFTAPRRAGEGSGAVPGGGAEYARGAVEWVGLGTSVVFWGESGILKMRGWAAWGSVPALSLGRPRITPLRKGGVHEGFTSQYRTISGSLSLPAIHRKGPMNAAISARKTVGNRPAFQKGLAIGAGSLVALLVLSAGLGYWNIPNYARMMLGSATPMRCWTPWTVSFRR